MQTNNSNPPYQQKSKLLDHLGDQAFVHVVFSGFKRLPETHRIIIICSSVETANTICVAKQVYDQEEWEKNTIEFWVESIPLDHMYGQTSLDRAQREKWRLKTGD